MGNASHQATAEGFVPPPIESGSLQTIITMQYPKKSIQIWQNRRKNAGASPASVPLMRPRITGRVSLKPPGATPSTSGAASFCAKGPQATELKNPINGAGAFSFRNALSVPELCRDYVAQKPAFLPGNHRLVVHHFSTLNWENF